ncbi:MAG: hypothetical protein M3O82_00340 [Verrucomicrobiota bacterium]|nr:hypothetical protein [Verrucomicrobiota bacterium]
MKTTLEIPDELYRQAKVQAARDNRKMKDLVTEGLRLVLGRTKKSPRAIRHGNVLPALTDEQMTELATLCEVWGVTPEEAMRRVAQAARDANASRKKALAVLEKIRRHPPYPPGRVQRMIDEASRLRKESWD